MEFVIAKSELSKAIVVTQSVVERKTTMPILANVLLSALDNTLKISATDFEITAVVSAKAKVVSAGSTTVNARVLADVVRELPDGDVAFKLGDGERLELGAGKSKFKIVGVSAEEFPSLPGLSTKVSGKISTSNFHEMINKTVYAVSQDETRFNLSGVCFELSEQEKKRSGSLKMVATDGHRLAMVTREVEGLSFAEKIIVPRKGLLEIRKILDNGGAEQVGIEVRDGFLAVESDQAKISIRLIDGEFPDYHQVLPKKRGTLVNIKAGDLAQAIRRVALMVSDKGKGIKLDFAPGSLRISSSSQELGEAREEMELNYEGEPLSVGFNAKYLLDFSQSLDEGQNISLELNGELGPGKFYAEGDESYVGVVMPMRLS